MALVRLRNNETIEEALRRFKKECEKSGILQEIKRREYYESPSLKKKRKTEERKRKQRRKILKGR